MTQRNYREVGSCVIIDKQNRILLLLRSKTDRWKPGWWDLPGGHLDGDETPMQGATREAFEECSLVVRGLIKIEAKEMGSIIKYFFATRDYSGSVDLIPNPETGVIEHDDYKWMTLQEIKALKNSIVPVSIVEEALKYV